MDGRSVAEEVVREVYLKLWQSALRFDPSRPGGRECLVYRLWAIRDGTPVSAGVFSVAASRRCRLEPDPEPIGGARLPAVRVEAAPGQPAPETSTGRPA